MCTTVHLRQLLYKLYYTAAAEQHIIIKQRRGDGKFSSEFHTFKLESNGRNPRNDGGGARARLSEYYGLNNGEEQDQEDKSQTAAVKKEPLRFTMRKLTPASGEPVQVNPYDINSPDFDADIYGQFLGTKKY